jgi:hypothetical protein
MEREKKDSGGREKQKCWTEKRKRMERRFLNCTKGTQKQHESDRTKKNEGVSMCVGECAREQKK